MEKKTKYYNPLSLKDLALNALLKQKNVNFSNENKKPIPNDDLGKNNEESRCEKEELLQITTHRI